MVLFAIGRKSSRTKASSKILPVGRLARPGVELIHRSVFGSAGGSILEKFSTAEVLRLKEDEL